MPYYSTTIFFLAIFRCLASAGQFFLPDAYRMTTAQLGTDLDDLVRGNIKKTGRIHCVAQQQEKEPRK